MLRVEVKWRTNDPHDAVKCNEADADVKMRMYY